MHRPVSWIRLFDTQIAMHSWNSPRRLSFSGSEHKYKCPASNANTNVDLTRKANWYARSRYDLITETISSRNVASIITFALRESFFVLWNVWKMKCDVIATTIVQAYKKLLLCYLRIIRAAKSSLAKTEWEAIYQIYIQQVVWIKNIDARYIFLFKNSATRKNWK